ncbi:MAG: hypothetical protein LC744_09025 [Chloroflexi bacterium]|nr:hypothetical protein [Chloroflexota bacterium]
MSALPFLDGDTMRAAVPIADMLDAVEAAFRDVAAGRDRSPLRTHVALPAGDLLLMPGVREGAAGTSVKLVTVTAGNAGRGMPTVQAIVVWLDALAEATGLEVVAAVTVEAAVREADVICCATTSAEPVLDAAWVRPGTHVNGIGAFRLGMVEMPPMLFARAALVAVDARAASMAEAGDVVAAIEAGLLAERDLVEIGSIAAGWADTRPSDDITVFKSVGLAIQDVAAAELIAGRLLGGGKARV